MRHEVPLRDNRNGLTEQRLEKPQASKSHHSTPKGMRINRKCRHTCPRTQPQTAGRRDFLDLKNRRSRACASGAYLPYVRMAHERDRRFLWLKSDGNSPTLTKPSAHNPTIHAFRDRVHNRISRKLPPRTTRTCKIPNASPKGMHLR